MNYPQYTLLSGALLRLIIYLFKVIICCVLGSIIGVAKLSFSVSLFIHLFMTAVGSLCVLKKNFKEMEFHNLRMNKLVYVSGMNWITVLYSPFSVIQIRRGKRDNLEIISHNAPLTHMSQPIIRTALLRHF